jgi:hypothetical protein
VVTLAGPFIVIAALAGAAGLLKIRRPATTERALREMGMPSSAGLVRAGAAAEVAVAVGALAWASRPFALALAASYLGFAGFVLAALRRGVALSSCGCFAVEDTPPTYGHVALNLTATAVAVAVAIGAQHGGAALGDLGRLDGPLLLKVVFVAVVAACAWFAYVALTLLPQVVGARSRPPVVGP